MTRLFTLVSASLLLVLAASLAGSANAAQKSIIVAGGCFWCVEADYDKVPGVVSATSGYTGGSAQTANYKTVSSGGTGHYEAVRVVYDPAKVSYRRLVDIFWRTVDPTDAGGQFCDRGSSYKTAVFAANAEEKTIALESKKKAEAALGRKIVTPILDRQPFYKAEGYHQNYYRKNPIRYKIYRYGCRRDARIGDLWGGQAHMGLKE